MTKVERRRCTEDGKWEVPNYMSSRNQPAPQQWRTFLLLGASTIPLVIGGAIYLLWRDTSLLMFRWLEALSLSQLIETIRGTSAIQSAHLPAWALYSLPNALWVLSLVAATGLLWRGIGRFGLTTAVIVAAGLGAGSEVLQGFRLLPGTFSITDLLLAALGATVGITVAFLGDAHAT